MKTYSQYRAAKAIGCCAKTIKKWIARGDIAVLNTICFDHFTYYEISHDEVMRVKRLKESGAMKRGWPKGRRRLPENLLTVSRLARIANRNPGTVWNTIKKGILKTRTIKRTPGAAGPDYITVIHRGSAKAWLRRRGITEAEL